MRVAVLGSGSRGNALALTADGHTLFVDAGFSLKELTRRAAESAVALEEVCGVLLTHEHGDHARGAPALARRVACPVYASAGTLQALADRLDTVETVPLLPHRASRIGPFEVTPAGTSHDAAEPYAYTVAHGPSGQRVAVAYDVGVPTQGLRYLLQDATCVVLEANHDDVLLRTSRYPASVRARIAGPGGHLSNRVAAELLADLWHPALSTIVLAHMSDECNRPDLARETVAQSLAETGFDGRLLVARQDRPLTPVDLGAGAPSVEVPD